MPGLAWSPSTDAHRQGSSLRLAFLQVTGLVQDVESDMGRPRPGTEATAWMQTRWAGLLAEGTRA